MDEVLRSAPWATKVGSHKAWNTAVLWPLRDADKPPEEKVIQQMFWSKEKTGWKFHQGIFAFSRHPGGCCSGNRCRLH